MKRVNFSRNIAAFAMLGVVAGLAPAITNASEDTVEALRVAAISAPVTNRATNLDSQIERMNADLLEELQADLEQRLRGQLAQAADEALVHLPSRAVTE